MTLAPAELVDGKGEYATLRLGDGSKVETRVRRSELPKSGELRLGVRPEGVRVVHDGKRTATAKVELVERLGERTLIYARLADGQPITAEDEGNSQVKMGDEVGIRIDGAAAHVFGPDGESHHSRARS